MRNTYKDISVAVDGGGSEAYVVSTAEDNLENYLIDVLPDYEPVLLRLRSEYRRIAIVRGIRVDEGCRGQGFGTRILEKIIDNALCNGAEAVLLECDLMEDNNFDIHEWYREYNFDDIAITPGGNPLMLAAL